MTIKVDRFPVNFRKFPNGESFLSKEICTALAEQLGLYRHYNEPILVEWSYRNDVEIFYLQILRDFITRMQPRVPVELRIYHLPYSRMDRSEEGMAFTLKSLSTLINNMNFDKVYIFDAHSDVSLAVIDRAQKAYSQFQSKKELQEVFIEKAMQAMDFNEEVDMIMFPDLGAAKRSKPYAKYIIVGNKKRDFATSKITHFEVIGNVNPGGRVLIVDDLSSFGGTFIGASKALKELGAKEVHLYVSHCELNAFKGDLFDHISHLYTTDSLLSYGELHTLDVEEKRNRTTLYSVHSENEYPKHIHN